MNDDLIYSYTDQQAIEDGIIHPFFTKEGKAISGHRVTNNALESIKKKYNKNDGEALEFIFCELLPLIPYAFKKYNKDQDILTTNFKFKVGNFKHSEILWFIPNENKGITVMLPSDY